MALIIYGRHTSYNVQKVLWFLEKSGVLYEHVELGSNPGDTETDHFQKMNPMRKVPVLTDNGRVIWESNTILRYLSSKYDTSDWDSDEHYERSLHERWMDWSQTYFEPAFIGVFWGHYRTPAKMRNTLEVQESLRICMTCLEKLDQQLSTQGYLAGNHLSLADICAGVFIYRLVEIDLGVLLPENVAHWYGKLQLSKGYKQWVMSDFSSLKGRLQY